MLFDAIEFAARAHRGQRRKASPLPYIYHPLAVARTLLEAGCEEELAIAALLHDTVEDTSVTLADLRQYFGSRIATLVEAVTEPDRTLPWEARKQHTLVLLKHAPDEVLLLLCADKLDNVRTMGEAIRTEGDAVWQRFSRPFPFQRWYHHAFLATLRLRSLHEPLYTLVTQLAAEVEALFGPAPTPAEVPATLREAWSVRCESKNIGT